MVDEKEYWDFSWAEMGLYDDTANIRKMKEVTGEEKVFYIGYSQGTSQMFYALAHLEDSFFAEHLYKALMFAPCLLLTDVTAYSGTLEQMRDLMD